MIIGIFTDSYLPYTSGVVRSIETFTEELNKTGHETFIFAPSYRNCKEESRVFRFTSIPSPTNPDFTLAVPFSINLRPTIRRLNLDLIHVHSPFLLGRLGAKYARVLGVPLVFTFHTLYDQYVHYIPFARSLTKELAQIISRDFCNQCDLVLAPTRIIENYLRQIGVKTLVQSVPTGIKYEQYQEGDRHWLRRKYNIPDHAKVLVSVGRLGKEKNIVFLLQSFHSLRQELYDVFLILVGGGPEEAYLKKMADDLGLGNRVIFTGTLQHMDVINCYAGSDLFVFSSVTETQGIVILEAKAAGLPVVAIDAYGVTEMVESGQDGFLTAPDLQVFTERIKLLLSDDSLRKDMGSIAKINAEKLSSANCTARLVEYYNQLLLNKSRVKKVGPI